MASSELIRLVKEAKIAKKLSIKDIADMTAEIGISVSERSIQRILAEGSEEKNTKNDRTLIPIATVLLPPDVIQAALKPKEKISENTQAVLEMKNQQIDVLMQAIETKDMEHQEHIDSLNAQHKEIIAKIREEAQARIDYHIAQEKRLHEEIEYLRLENNRKAKIIDKFLEK